MRHPVEGDQIVSIDPNNSHYDGRHGTVVHVGEKGLRGRHALRIQVRWEPRESWARGKPRLVVRHTWLLVSAQGQRWRFRDAADKVPAP